MQQFSVVSPYKQELLATLSYTAEAETEQCLQRGYELSRRSASWPKEQRLAFLHKLANALLLDQEVYAQQIALEGGKPIRDARVEAERAVQSIRATIAGLYQWVGQEIPMGLSAASTGRWAFTRREPRGLVLAISAFNHPLNLIVHQVIPALAVGCPVLIKPSLKTPLTCQRFVQLMQSCDLPESWCQMLLIDDAHTEKLAADPRIAVLSFIGASQIGWKLRRQQPAGAHALLEHGGTAPLILNEDADLERVIPLIIKGGFYHAGQVCVSVQNVFVHESLLSQCREQLKAAILQLQTGDPLDPNTDVGPMIRPDEVQRVLAWIQEAKDQGAKVLQGGVRLSSSCLSPALIEGATEFTRLYREEIFGPVVGLYPFQELDSCIERINQSRFAFQASIFTDNIHKALQACQNLEAGTVLINDHTAFRVDWMPFAGHKHSGSGIGGILPSMLELSQEKLIILRSSSID